MPLWFIAAAIGAFIVYKHAHNSAAGSATGGTGGPVSITDSNGVSYTLQTDPKLDAATLNQIKSFFATAGQTDATATALVTQLVAQGLTTTAQGVQSIYGQMQSNNSLKAQMMGT